MSSLPEKERILVVDDSPSTLEVLHRNLKAEGYQVLTSPGVRSRTSLYRSIIFSKRPFS